MMKKNNFDSTSMIVYQDEDYIVINKPAFLSTLADRNSPNNVLSIFRKTNPNIQVCHRLDKETSGILLLAQHEVAYRHAALQFQNRKVEKVYHTLVKGYFSTEVVQVDVPLRVTGAGRARPNKRCGKETTTIFRLKEQKGEYSLIEAKPLTGRTHQIRAHLAYLGFPICGDDLYGGSPIYVSELKKGYKLKENQEERPLLRRVALHAYSLQFNTLKKNNILIFCHYPKIITNVMQKIEKFEQKTRNIKILYQ